MIFTVRKYMAAAVFLLLAGQAAVAQETSVFDEELAKPYALAALQAFLSDHGVKPFFDSMACRVLSSAAGGVVAPPAKHSVVLAQCRLSDGKAGTPGGRPGPGTDVQVAGVLVPGKNKFYVMFTNNVYPYSKDVPKIHIEALRKNSPDHVIVTEIGDEGTDRKDMGVFVYRPAEDKMREVYWTRMYHLDTAEEYGGDQCGYSFAKTEKAQLVYGPWDKSGLRRVSVLSSTRDEVSDGARDADGKCRKTVSEGKTTRPLVWEDWRLREAEKKK